jgi:hypothetical protein
MRRVSARAVAATLSLLCGVLLVATVVLWALGVRPPPPSGWGTAGVSVVLPLLPLAFTIVGAVIALRQSANRIGWVCLAIGGFLLLGNVAGAYSSYERSTGSAPLPGTELATWLDSWTWIPAIGSAGTFLLLLFPDGRLPSPRWRVAAWTSAAVIVLVALSNAFRPGALPNEPGVVNPFAIEAARYLPGRLPGGANVMLPICFLAAAAALVIRFRRAGGRERLQLKWFAFAAALLATLFAVAAVTDLVAGVVGAGRPLGVRLLEDAVSTSAVGLPLAIGIAVLRHNLYEIDVIINRTLVYGALTASLAAAYLGLVLLFQLALSPLTRKSDLAVAVSTLAVAALARPLRGRIQEGVDRRFYRRRYDARRTLERFGAHLRDELDPGAVGIELREVVEQTMQPAHMSLWLRGR